MSEFKGTKGPWEILEDDSELKVIQSGSIDTGCGWRSYVPICEEISGINNANLIAAAPELLEALQDAMKFYDPYGEQAEWDFSRAAIAKALGQ